MAEHQELSPPEGEQQPQPVPVQAVASNVMRVAEKPALPEPQTTGTLQYVRAAAYPLNAFVIVTRNTRGGR